MFLLVFLPINSFAELPECKSDVISIDDKIKCLDIQIKEKELASLNSWFSDPISQQGIVQTFVIIAAIATALIAWKKERDKPIEQQQVKSFNESMIESNFEYYLKNWNKVWRKLTTGENEYDKLDSKKVDLAWNSIPLKGTKLEESEDRLVWDQTVMRAWKKAKRMNYHYITKLGDIKEYQKSVEHLRYISKVKYYTKVSEMIPDLTSRAVYAHLPLNLDRKQVNIDDWESKSLTALKILMIFSFIREQDDVLKIMIKSEINQILATQKEDP